VALLSLQLARLAAPAGGGAEPWAAVHTVSGARMRSQAGLE
jgi:hypothetical protein